MIHDVQDYFFDFFFELMAPYFSVKMQFVKLVWGIVLLTYMFVLYLNNLFLNRYDKGAIFLVIYFA